MPSEEELRRLQEQYGEMLGKRIGEGMTPLDAASVATVELISSLHRAGLSKWLAVIYIAAVHAIGSRPE